MTKKGLLVVVSGPAGSGKGTVNKQLIDTGDFAFSVSATTRAPRPGEVDGVNYHYISREEFENRIGTGDMIEYTSYCGNYYGTPRKEVEEVLNAGKNIILEIEVNGAVNVKREYPDAVLILLLPPTFAEQEARLRGRGTETEDKILARLETSKEEIARFGEYQYVVYNRDGESRLAVDDILAIVRAEKLSVSRNQDVDTLYFQK